jgi:Tfp pilus assembly PilM family ATPase
MFESIRKLKKMFSETPFGLHITDSYIQIVQLEGEPTSPKVKVIKQKNIGSGVVKNGAVLMEKTLGDSIKTLLAEIPDGAIKTKKCFITSPETKSFEHIFYLPVLLEGGEFTKNLEKMISETIPMPLYELKYDYSIAIYGKVKVVFVVAVPKIIIAQYYDVVKNQADLDPVAMEPESLSLLRNIPIKLEKDNGIIIIDLDNEKATWFVFWDDDIFDSNVISSSDTAGDPNYLKNDIARSIKEFNELTKRTISSILLSGGVKTELESMQKLMSELGVPVSIIEKYRINLAKPEDNDNYKTAIGLALGGIENDLKINLLKK